MVGSVTSRAFSSFSKVQGGSISLSTHYPPKLRVPVDDHTSYDFTLTDNESVQEFENKVRSTAANLNSFKILNEEASIETLLKQ